MKQDWIFEANSLHKRAMLQAESIGENAFDIDVDGSKQIMALEMNGR